MDGSGPRGRTLLTVPLAVLALLLAPGSAALAQSAGDRQYSDPLVTDGGGNPPSAADPDAPVSSDDPGSAGADAGTTPPSPPAEPSAPAVAETGDSAAATLPRTGSDTWLLALIGAALTAGGALALAVARAPRHARR